VIVENRSNSNATSRWSSSASPQTRAYVAHLVGVVRVGRVSSLMSGEHSNRRTVQGVQRPGRQPSGKGMWRRTLTAVIACAVALGVSSCARAPTDAELAGAAAAREDGHRMLGRFDFTPPAGFTVAASRTVDACGSPTSDRGGLNDRHVMGYECFVVERVVYIPAGDGSYNFDAAVQELATGFGVTASPRWDGPYMASERIEVDGVVVLVNVRRDLIDDENSILDHFPLGGWLANDLVHEDRGDLLDRLPKLIASGESEVVAGTVSVRYFRDAPGAPD
jgi:hypothetical protein